MRGTPTKIYFDGGCRPNPGTMESAVVARGELHHRPDVGQGTSEQAEWLALLDALAVARSLGERDVLLLGDSAGVIAQVIGETRCRSFDLREQYAHAITGFDRVRVRYIKRSQNLAGIALGLVRQGRIIKEPARKEPVS